MSCVEAPLARYFGSIEPKRFGLHRPNPLLNPALGFLRCAIYRTIGLSNPISIDPEPVWSRRSTVSTIISIWWTSDPNLYMSQSARMANASSSFVQTIGPLGTDHGWIVSQVLYYFDQMFTGCHLSPKVFIFLSVHSSAIMGKLPYIVIRRMPGRKF
jgi:hypothetical protein